MPRVAIVRVKGDMWRDICDNRDVVNVLVRRVSIEEISGIGAG